MKWKKLSVDLMVQVAGEVGVIIHTVQVTGGNASAESLLTQVRGEVDTIWNRGFVSGKHLYLPSDIQSVRVVNPFREEEV